MLSRQPRWRSPTSTVLWPAIISSVSALLGVAMGGFLTARVQKRQWARGQQIEACAAIVVESTRVQLSLRGQWKHDQRVDWVSWNEALAKISLVADRAVVEAAGETDAVFWRHSDRIDRGEITDEAAWFAATEPMEAARLAFVNTAKHPCWARRVGCRSATRQASATGPARPTSVTSSHRATCQPRVRALSPTAVSAHGSQRVPDGADWIAVYAWISDADALRPAREEDGPWSAFVEVEQHLGLNRESGLAQPGRYSFRLAAVDVNPHWVATVAVGLQPCFVADVKAKKQWAAGA